MELCAIVRYSTIILCSASGAMANVSDRYIEPARMK